MQYLFESCSQLEAASEVISGLFVGPVVPDKTAIFRDPCSNHSRGIPLEAVGCGFFDSFSRYYFRPEVDNDVVSVVSVDHIGVDSVFLSYTAAGLESHSYADDAQVCISFTLANPEVC